MARINPRLIEKLKEIPLSKTQIYRLIEQKVRLTHLPRHLAAIEVAADYELPLAKIATSDDLERIRGAGISPLKEVNVAPAPIRFVKTTEPIKIDLDFVRNAKLRSNLQKDLAELNVAHSQKESRTAKTCMVLCGSIAEALLLYSLSQRSTAARAVAKTLPNPPSNNFEDWALDVMVTVATKMNPPLLAEDAVAGAHQLRKWRNLIHPGRQLKDARNKRIIPSAARAKNAIAFLQLIAEELTPKKTIKRYSSKNHNGSGGAI